MNTDTSIPVRRSPNARVTPPREAGSDNLDPFFLLVLEQLGFEVVAVRFDVTPDSPLWHHPELGKALGDELQAIRAGELDSESWLPGGLWLWFYVRQLAPAMQCLKAGLESRGLLAGAAILHVESPLSLIVWHPPTADEIRLDS